MGDGSVKLVRTSMDIRQFVKFITREGNDLTPADNGNRSRRCDAFCL